MALSSITKRHFAEELQRLAKDRPITRISVAEICRASDATRQTFYYHFHDKYDLVAWIYLQDLSDAAGPEGDIGLASLTRMLEAIRSKAGFYRSALQDSSQNNLMSYIVDYGTDFMLDSLERSRRLEPTDRLRMTVRYHSHGMVGLTFDWLEGGCQTGTDELAGLMSRNIELILRDFTS